VGGEGVGVLLLPHVPQLHHVLRPARRQLVPIVQCVESGVVWMGVVWCVGVWGGGGGDGVCAGGRGE
jgi:hypothetical protein